MKKFVKSKMFLQVILASSITILVVAAVASAGTTIGSNITTTGTLSVTDTSTLTGAVTTGGALTVGTDLTVTSGAQIGATGASTHITALGDNTLSVAGQSEFDSITWFDGSLRASSTLMVTSDITANADLTVISGARIGTGSDGTHITALDGDSLLVEGQGEFDGITWFDGSLRASSTLMVTGNANFYGVTSINNASSTLANFGGGTTVSDLHFGTCTVTFGNITASSTAVANCTATGASTNHQVFVTPNITNPQIIFSSASSTADDVIQIAVYNTGVTGIVDPNDNVWSWMAIK